jgi:ferric-dicitrate binding protein FerR (iron transport regulator)
MWYVLSGVGVGVALLVAGLKFGSVQLLGGRATSEPAYTTYTTANGQRATITLSDGSTVTLNVASRLDVPVDYTRGDHALRLSGAALFKVLHHDLTPFTVVAGGTTTRVLGTSFVVRSYANDTAVTVAVRDGKVGVGSLVLTAERQVVIGHSGAPRVRVADPAQFSFATGVLTLTGGLLADAIPELDRWYNADIRLGDPGLGSQRIQGNVSAGSLAELAAMLEWTYNVRVVRDGQVLTLFPR